MSQSELYALAALRSPDLRAGITEIGDASEVGAFAWLILAAPRVLKVAKWVGVGILADLGIDAAMGWLQDEGVDSASADDLLTEIPASTRASYLADLGTWKAAAGNTLNEPLHLAAFNLALQRARAELEAPEARQSVVVAVFRALDRALARFREAEGAGADLSGELDAEVAEGSTLDLGAGEGLTLDFDAAGEGSVVTATARRPVPVGAILLGVGGLAALAWWGWGR